MKQHRNGTFSKIPLRLSNSSQHQAKGLNKVADYGELEERLLAVFSTGHRPDYVAARRLLEQGADINAEPLEQRFPDDRGQNSLSDILSTNIGRLMTQTTRRQPVLCPTPFAFS